jgi:hypothetical protein
MSSRGNALRNGKVRLVSSQHTIHEHKDGSHERSRPRHKAGPNNRKHTHLLWLEIA